jgi:hypothetical protein
MAQAVQCLPSKPKVLSSNHSTEKKKKPKHQKTYYKHTDFYQDRNPYKADIFPRVQKALEK